jgi:hypothetical protein
MASCAKQKGFLSSYLLQSVDGGCLNNSKLGTGYEIRVRAVSGESQAARNGEERNGEERNGEPARTTKEKPIFSIAAGKISS